MLTSTSSKVLILHARMQSIRAGVINYKDGYRFSHPPSWKEQKIANIQSGNFCMVSSQSCNGAVAVSEDWHEHRAPWGPAWKVNSCRPDPPGPVSSYRVNLCSVAESKRPLSADLPAVAKVRRTLDRGGVCR